VELIFYCHINAMIFEDVDIAIIVEELTLR
jgi:hypothetical protein